MISRFVVLFFAVKVICAAKFFIIDNKNYFISHPMKLNWHEAQRYCIYHGMFLIDIHTEEENNRVLSIIKGEDYKDIAEKTFWTSGNDLGSEGEFYWASTGHPVIFSDWPVDGHQPDNANGNEHCLEIREPFDFKWNDHVCEISKYFICRNVTGSGYAFKYT